jgi:hypothetical protein
VQTSNCPLNFIPAIEPVVLGRGRGGATEAERWKAAAGLVAAPSKEPCSLGGGFDV